MALVTDRVIQISVVSIFKTQVKIFKKKKNFKTENNASFPIKFGTWSAGFIALKFIRFAFLTGPPKYLITYYCNNCICPMTILYFSYLMHALTVQSYRWKSTLCKRNDFYQLLGIWFTCHNLSDAALKLSGNTTLQLWPKQTHLFVLLLNKWSWSSSNLPISAPINDSRYPPQQNEVVHTVSVLLMPAAALKPPSETTRCEEIGCIIA